MSKIRVLIVDDSSAIRLLLKGELSKDPELEVSGTCHSNGKDGCLEKIAAIFSGYCHDGYRDARDGRADCRERNSKDTSAASYHHV